MLRMGRFSDPSSCCSGEGKFKQNNSNKTPKKKKNLEDYYFYVRLSKQALDYETTYKFLVNLFKDHIPKKMISQNP